MGDIPAGHWQEQEILEARGFPTRCAGEPYVVVIHKRDAGAFVLDGVYHLLHEELTRNDDVVHRAMMHHLDTWDPWKPSGPDQMPWWAKAMPSEDFVAFWVAK